MNNLFDTYTRDIVQGVLGSDIVHKLELETCKKPFCKIELDFNRELSNQRATVVSTARLTDPTQKIYYLLKWDSPESAPGGNHLGQDKVDYSGRFVEDKDAQGRPITIPCETNQVFYDNNIFYFADNIEQENLSGVWTFKIVVTDEKGNLLCSDSIDIKWN